MSMNYWGKTTEKEKNIYTAKPIPAHMCVHNTVLNYVRQHIRSPRRKKQQHVSYTR